MNALLILIAGLGSHLSQQQPPLAFNDLRDLAVKQLQIEQVPTDGPIEIRVDGRIELLNIIFRLAGSEEFRGDDFKAYSVYLDSRFKPFENHPAVELARKLRSDPGVGWDAVVLLAIHLSELPELRPRVSLDNPSLRARWRVADAEKFSALARDFAKDSNFGEFLKTSQPIHDLASMRMRKLVRAEVDRKWWTRFFSEKEDARFILPVGLLNGAISYGVHVHPAGHPEEIYANLGLRQVDGQGLPVFDESDLATIVHEFSHSFVNPAVDRSKALLKPSGEAFRTKVAELVKPLRYFYWQTLIEETLVRAVVVRYLRERKGEQAASTEAERQKKEGFVWIEEVVSLLDAYAKSRSQYPTFDTFMPRVGEYLAALTPRLQDLVDKPTT